MDTGIKRLNRFTTLPVLLDLLHRKKLVLLDPDSWDDKNDSKIISKYKEYKKVNVCAICFSMTSETVHHWKTFSNGVSGCCIQFNAQKLFEIVNSINGVRHDPVQYKRINDVGRNPISLEKVPFTKRLPYECEKEYRIIFETNEEIKFFEIDIPLEIIEKITFSQQMHPQIYDTLKKHLKSAFPDLSIKINHSTLYENHKWLNHF